MNSLPLNTKGLGVVSNILVSKLANEYYNIELTIGTPTAVPIEINITRDGNILGHYSSLKFGCEKYSAGQCLVIKIKAIDNK